MANFYILTGEKQTGKTTILQEWRKQNHLLKGIITPIDTLGKRIFKNIATNEIFSMEAERNNADGIAIGKYIFSIKAFEKANQVILESFSTLPPFLIIDEIGPLEIKQQQGFYLTLLYVSNFYQNTCTIILVVRPSCLKDIENLLRSNNHQVSVYSIETFKQQILEKYFYSI
ncbi:MAG: nucleoside-triphosphatase [Chitinophagaceae bacterium]